MKASVNKPKYRLFLILALVQVIFDSLQQIEAYRLHHEIKLTQIPDNNDTSPPGNKLANNFSTKAPRGNPSYNSDGGYGDQYSSTSRQQPMSSYGGGGSRQQSRSQMVLNLSHLLQGQQRALTSSQIERLRQLVRQIQHNRAQMRKAGKQRSFQKPRCLDRKDRCAWNTIG